MAANKSIKKNKIKTLGETQDSKGVANEENKGLMNIAEVRMVLYVVPIALILALFVYFITR
jgi:hypothetical protein